MIVHSDGRVKDDFDYLNGKDFREINEAAYGATLRAHSEKMPCMVLEVEKLTPYSFGEIFISLCIHAMYQREFWA